MRVVEALEPQRRRPWPCRSFGHEPDELGAGDLDAASRGLGLDSRDDLVERRRLPVLDVHRHLDEPAAGEREAERANAAEAAARLADDGRDRLRDGEVVGSEIDVERDERPAGADEDAAGGRVEPRRAAVGGELSGVDAPLELADPPRRSSAGRTPGASSP